MKGFRDAESAEQLRHHTLLTNPQLSAWINSNRRTRAARSSSSRTAPSARRHQGDRSLIEGGRRLLYPGGISDKLYKEGKIDQIAKALEHIRQSGVPRDRAHLLGTVQECVRLGMKPISGKDLHRCDYWSARVGEEENDNIWCTDPEESCGS